MSPDDWLARLAAEQAGGCGLAAPPPEARLVPERGGRGVLVARPEARPLGNGESVRFMAPGLSPQLRGGYTLITDAAGGYVVPWTGESRFSSGNDAAEEPPDEATDVPEQPTEWSWPDDARRPVSLDGADAVFRGRQIRELYVDDLGWRLILDRLDWTDEWVDVLEEPRAYIDVYEMRLLSAGVDREPDSGRVAGTSIERVAAAAGRLRLSLSNGDLLEGLPDENLESWQLCAAGAGLWVCLPGGQLGMFELGAGLA